MSAGRPSKYRPEMCEELIEIMKEGASLVEVAALLDISETTIHEWKSPDSDYYIPEFSASVKKGIRLSAAWWENAGRTNLKDKDFSYTGWYMNMKNRFDWADKTENKNEHVFASLSDTPLSNDEWQTEHKPK